MSDKVITGALIEIQATPRGGQTVAIGRAMALNIQESYRIGPVYGIGSLTARELPILQYAGGFSCQQFAISRSAVENLMSQFKRQGAPGVPNREAFIRQLLYTDGVDVTVWRREKDAQGNINNIALARINGAVCTGETMQIQENSIVIRNGEFMFADPVSV